MFRKTQTKMLAWGNYNMLQDFISPVIDNWFKCNFIFVNMPHRIYISVLLLFMIMPQLIINTYVTLMYELKKNWKGIYE